MKGHLLGELFVRIGPVGDGETNQKGLTGWGHTTLFDKGCGRGEARTVNDGNTITDTRGGNTRRQQITYNGTGNQGGL